MARPKKDDSRDTRRDILDRALELFATHGFTGSSMRDIAKAVGVRESALYHHFPNKNAILTTLLEESGPGAVNGLMTGDLVRIIESMGPQQFLKTMGEAVVALWASDRERHLLRLIMAEFPRLKEAGLFDVQKQLMSVRARLGQVFASLAEKALIRPVDPVTTALRFMGPLLMIRLLHLADISRPPDVDAMRADLTRHLDSFWDTVKPEAPPSKRNRR
jgi:AcrR family transcriptional regulator